MNESRFLSILHAELRFAVSGSSYLSRCRLLRRLNPGLGIIAWVLALPLVSATPPGGKDYFELQALDEDTQRGIPLVEFETVDRLRFVSDSAGRVAFHEPGLMNQEVYFKIASHGYTLKPDGFGYAGVRAKTVPGAKTTVALKRVNLAERLYRVTGAGIYRDSVLLGYETPLPQPLLNAQVVGQDSTQATVYHGRIAWFWGDTARLSYPLGNFRTTGATSALPNQGGLDPTVGIDLRYFTNREGFTRGMCAFEPKEGVVWIDGLGVVDSGHGQERLVCRFARLKGLGAMLEHGLAVFSDERDEFERDTAFKLEESWQCPRGQALSVNDSAGSHLLFCTPFPAVRVAARLEALRRPDAYEAWSCLADGSEVEARKARLLRDEQGSLIWRWTHKAPPVGPKEEKEWISAGLMQEAEAQFLPVDVESGKRVRLHGGSVRWNPWRKRWILIAVEQDGTSFLGEVWYGEASAPTGPWRKVRKIVTHKQYTFYNPVHHAFLDQAGGRLIYFEGTYSREFSGNPEATPRYDYNQILYRLDLDDPRLTAVRD